MRFVSNNKAIVVVICGLVSAPVLGADPGAVYKPFAVYSGRANVQSHYAPSGYMGDNDLSLSGASVPTHDSIGTPLRVRYKEKGSKGWSGIYWQQPANNWGDRPGLTGFDLHDAHRLIFWARGERGGEKIHEVKVGGLVGHYPDSDVATAGPFTLTQDWQRFEIDLKGKDLKHIIGGFAFSVLKYENRGETTFYLDDIVYELPQSTLLPAAQSSVVETTPVATAKTAPEPPVAPSKDIQIKSEEDGLRVSFSTQFLFNVGKTELRPESQRILGQVITILKTYSKNDVLVEGHTDSTGSADFNLKLSRLRAEHVRDYLVKQGGFNTERFRVVGYGATQPVADNANVAGRAINRRVEVIILKQTEKQ